MNCLKCDSNNLPFNHLNYCNIESLNLTLVSREQDVTLYKLLCPPLVICCLLSVLLNLTFISIGRCAIKKRSPVLKLSLNLAATDTLASFLNGFDFVVSSYLPVVFNIRVNVCTQLVIELAKSSTLISSVLHLLALAFVHYNGIIRPLHYR